MCDDMTLALSTLVELGDCMYGDITLALSTFVELRDGVW